MTFPTPRLSFAALALTAILGLGACATTGTMASDSYATSTLLSADAKQALGARVTAFDRDMNSGNISAVMDYLPPKMIAQLSDSVGADPEFMKAAAGAMLEGLTRELTIAGRSDLSQALVGTAGNGNPYALVPGAASITAGKETMVQQGTTLALLDGGQWYLVGLSDAETVTDIRKAYPEFRGVALPVRQN